MPTNNKEYSLGIPLEQFLLGIQSYSKFTYICTNNETFPEKWRFNFEFYASLYNELKKHESDNILNRRVQEFKLTPITFKNNSKYEYNNVILDSDCGYYYIDSKGKMIHTAIALEIFLER